MTTPLNTSPSPLMWISSIAIVLFSSVGIAAFMGWLPSSYGKQNTETEPVVVAEVAAVKPVHKAHTHVSSSTQVAANNVPSRAICAECGVIESVRVVDEVKKTSGLGLVGGAVVGGLLGNQVGGGRGKDVATVAGAVGGAVAGDAIEKNSGSTKSYEVVVRFADGTRRVFNEANPPAWQSGDHVRVINGAIRSDG